DVRRPLAGGASPAVAVPADDSGADRRRPGHGRGLPGRPRRHPALDQLTDRFRRYLHRARVFGLWILDRGLRTLGRDTGLNGFLDRRDRWLNLTGLLGVAIVLVGIYMAFQYAPTDRVQGHAQRIFYIHVPMAWLAYLAYAVLFVGAIGYLWKKDWKWDRLARASAELGFLFTSLVLISGSLWGRPIWGTWWQWEARLTTTLILWFIYLGYFMLRSYAGDREKAARHSAVLGIIGMIDIPIIHQSVKWW